MTVDERDFRKLRFRSPKSFDPRWYDWFQEEFSRQVYGVEASPHADVPLRLESTTRLLPEVAVHVGSYSAMTCRATREFAEKGAIGLYVVLDGEARFGFRGRSVDMKPGMAVVGGAGNGGFRREDLGALEIPEGVTELAIGLSPHLMTSLVPDFFDLGLVSIAKDSEALRLLLAYLRMLGREEAIVSPEVRHLAAVHIHDLVALALRTSGDVARAAGQRGGRAARLAAVKNDILAHLLDPDLSVGAVAKRQGLTPRYIHMLFKDEGVTFSEYVLAERLDWARRTLADPAYSGRAIGEIAFASGFGDLSYFNRTFRRRFGGTPSEVRAGRHG
jgi:AraC-like DNA-binding protein